MGAARKYAVIDPATGKIDRRIFGAQASTKGGELPFDPKSNEPKLRAPR
jgi:hypothetical protein